MRLSNAMHNITKQLPGYHTLLLTAHQIIDLLSKLDDGQLFLSQKILAYATFALII